MVIQLRLHRSKCPRCHATFLFKQWREKTIHYSAASAFHRKKVARIAGLFYIVFSPYIERGGYFI